MPPQVKFTGWLSARLPENVPVGCIVSGSRIGSRRSIEASSSSSNMIRTYGFRGSASVTPMEPIVRSAGQMGTKPAGLPTMLGRLSSPTLQ